MISYGVKEQLAIEIRSQVHKFRTRITSRVSVNYFGTETTKQLMDYVNIVHHTTLVVEVLTEDFLKDLKRKMTHLIKVLDEVL